MAIQHELSKFQYSEIIGTWKCNFSVRGISELLNHPKSTVQDIISAYKNNGLEKMPSRVGWPSITTERDNHHLNQILNKKKKTHLKELCENFILSTSTNISPVTLRRHLHNNNIFGRVGAKKPFVNAVNKIKRLNWAKTKKDWITEWENIIWSDESKFEVFGGDGKKYIWRNSQEKYNPECLVPTFKSKRQSVMVWDCFTKNKLGPLIQVSGSITDSVYINLLENTFLPFYDSLKDDLEYIFQDDNTPVHRARTVRQ